MGFFLGIKTHQWEHRMGVLNIEEPMGTQKIYAPWCNGAGKFTLEW
jgi:hypothetical protein